MDEKRAFLVLGIEIQKDEGAIKKAYRAKLKGVNPEDDPEGFKELRSAYETALKYAASSDSEENRKPETPLEEWERRLDALYGHLSSRLNIDAWKELMEDDLCISLDTSQECRDGLLRYLMSHFRLPTLVWQYLDQVWAFTEDTGELYERYPKDFVDFLINVCQSGSWFPMEKFSGADDGDYDLYVSLYFELDQALYDGEQERAGNLIAQIDGLGLSHPYGELDKARWLLTAGKQEEARGIFEGIYEKFPEDNRIHYIGGLIAWELGEKDLARQLFLKLLEANPHNFTANKMLGRYWLEKGDLEKAKEYTIEALDGGTNGGNREPETVSQLNEINNRLIEQYRREIAERPEDMRPVLELGWSYLQNERLTDALALLAGRIPEEEFAEEYHNLMGKLYYNNEQFERALEHITLWVEYLEKQPVNPEEGLENKTLRRKITASGILARIYRRFAENGRTEYFDMALAQIDRTFELGSRDPAYWMEKAAIYKARAEKEGNREDYGRAVELLTELLKENPGFFPAYVMRQECHAALRDARGVVEDYFQAKNIYAGFAPVYEAAAEVYSDLEHWGELEELVKEAKENQADSPVVRMFQYRMIRERSESREETEEALKGLEIVRKDMDEAEETDKRKGEAEAEIAVTLGFLGKNEEALEAIARARKLDPEQARYVWIRGNILRRMGRCSEALECYGECETEYGESGSYQYFVGDCLERTGKRLESIQHYKKAYETDPENPDYIRRLADVYQSLFDNLEKTEYFRQGIHYADLRILKAPTSYDHVNRGLLYLQAGQNQKALEDFLKAGELDPQNQYAWVNVGCAYKRMGEYEKALEYVKRAISLMESEPSSYFYENLGSIYMRMGEYEKALEAFRENLRRYPKKMSAAENVGTAFCRLGRWEEALEMWKEFFLGKDAKFYDKAFSVYETKRDFKLAENARQKAVHHSGKGKGDYRKAELLAQHGKLGFLGMAVEKAVKSCAGGDSFNSACVLAVEYFFLKGKQDKARKYADWHMEELLKQHKTIENYLDTYSDKRVCYYSLFIIALGRGEADKAREYLKELCSCHWCYRCDRRCCVEELGARAYIALLEGNKKEALDLAKEMLREEPAWDSGCLIEGIIKGV